MFCKHLNIILVVNKRDTILMVCHMKRGSVILYFGKIADLLHNGDVSISYSDHYLTMS